MNTQIACAATEQSSVSEEINRNVANIDTVAAQVSDGAKQASQTSSHLATQIVGLRTELDRFKV